MVGIECTRCHSTGTGYPNLFQAKFTLVHKIGCGAKIGVPKFSSGAKTTQAETTTVSEEKPIIVSHKPKKKKVKKKAI